MSYSEFDINSAINPVVSKESYKLQGVTDVAKVYNSRSMSTEEFVSGAIHNLGVVNRSVMYVNSSLSGLRDRLAIAAHVAKNVNAAKDHGMEAFSNVSRMDPWEYALEDSNQSFFSKVWQAICTACRRLITAIVNVIKHIQIAIANTDSKKADRDYKYYVQNRRLFDNKKEALNTKLNCMDWKFGGDKMLKTISKVSGDYINAFRGIWGTGGDGAALEKAAQFDMSLAKDMAGFKTIISKAFGIHITAEGNASGLKSSIDKYREEISKPLFSVCSDAGMKASELTNLPSASTVAHKLLLKNDGKVVQKTVKEMKDLSGDFAVLAAGGFAKSVAQQVSSLNDAVKQFTKYTKTVDKLSAQFKKAGVDGVKSGTLKSISSACSELSNARIRANSWMTTLMLELELTALRFRKNTHTALSVYMRGATATPKKESKESLNADMLFSF